MQERLQPALWGGLFIGVLSALPLVNLGNCCCCLWVLAGGALAAYLRQQSLPYQIAAAEGALVGLMAGVVGAIVDTVLSIPLQMAVGPFQQQLMERIMSQQSRHAAGASRRVRPGRRAIGRLGHRVARDAHHLSDFRAARRPAGCRGVQEESAATAAARHYRRAADGPPAPDDDLNGVRPHSFCLGSRRTLRV